jgi:hypothetical protein
MLRKRVGLTPQAILAALRDVQRARQVRVCNAGGGLAMTSAFIAPSNPTRASGHRRHACG